MPYLDGYASPDRETSVIPMFEYPFAGLPDPDIYALVSVRSYLVTPAGYVPKIAARNAFTNNFNYSEDFTNAAWSSAAVTITPAARANPFDGQLTATRFAETAANSTHYLRRAWTFAPIQQIVWALVSPFGRDYVRLTAEDGTNTFLAFFNIATGVVVSQSGGGTASCLRLSDGTCLISLSYTPASGAGFFYILPSPDGSTISYAGNTGKGFYCAGFQLEAAVIHGPYISTTSVARSISSPDQDVTINALCAAPDPFAYLVDETNPKYDTSAFWSVDRKFARVPKTQNVPTSLVLSKPAPPSVSGVLTPVFGPFTLNQTDTSLQTFDAYFNQTVTADSGVPTLPTGGTFTVTFGANTTAAQAYNVSAGTLQTALNALASVIAYGSLVVTGAYNTGGFTITWAQYAAGSVAATSLTPSGSVGSYTNASDVLKAVSIVGPVDAPTTTMDYSSITGSDGIHFASYNPNTSPPSVAVQIGGGNTPVGGSFTLTIDGQTTAAIPVTATVVETTAALNALGVGSFTLFGTAGAPTILQNTGKILFFSFTRVTKLTGGTYTLTVLGQTTGAINYNASTSTISTAVNALSNVTARGGITIGGSGLSAGIVSFTITHAAIPVVTANAASLTPTSTINIASNVTGFIQTLAELSSATARVLTIPSHGFVGGEYLMFNRGGTRFYGYPWTYLSPDQIAVNGTVAPFNIATAFTVIGKQTKAGYSVGTSVIRANNETDFYLPGVTQGITTAADIPLDVSQSGPTEFLLAVFAGTGTINYAVGQLVQWMGPILQQTTTTVEVIDV